MMRPTVLALVTAAAVAGCGSSSTHSSKPTPLTNGTIEMKDIAFSPKDATVRVGQKVTWVNRDSVSHNVVAVQGAFKSDDFGQNGRFSWIPKKAGTYAYECTLHPGMTATLTVTG